jgi:hypothetical protein
LSSKKILRGGPALFGSAVRLIFDAGELLKVPTDLFGLFTGFQAQGDHSASPAQSPERIGLKSLEDRHIAFATAFQKLLGPSTVGVFGDDDALDGAAVDGPLGGVDTDDRVAQSPYLSKSVLNPLGQPLAHGFNQLLSIGSVDRFAELSGESRPRGR